MSYPRISYLRIVFVLFFVVVFVVFFGGGVVRLFIFQLEAYPRSCIVPVKIIELLIYKCAFLFCLGLAYSIMAFFLRSKSYSLKSFAQDTSAVSCRSPYEPNLQYLINYNLLHLITSCYQMASSWYLFNVSLIIIALLRTGWWYMLHKNSLPNYWYTFSAKDLSIKMHQK